MKPPFSSNATLNDLLKEALRLHAAQTPEQRKDAVREQAINWAYGQLTCTGRRPYITRELVERLYDERHAAGKDLSEE